MTARGSLISVLLAASLAGLLVCAGGVRLAGAAARARDAGARLREVRHDAERVMALRARSQTVAEGEQPSQDIFRQVNATLDAAGLGGVRVHSVNPAGDRAADADPSGGPAPRVQTVRVVLEPLKLAELGSFLDRWRGEQSLWVVTGVDLAPTSRGGHAESYRATLTASAMYVPTKPARDAP